ncbi:MAG: STAS domain-containing protein [Planctomycetota bacterium]
MQQLDADSPIVNDVRWDDPTGSLLAKIDGEIDLHVSPGMREVLMGLVDGRPVKKLVLNLEGVPYMDSSAIAVLVELLQKLRANEGRIFLCNLHERVRGLLEIARLETIFELVDSEQNALGS